MIAMTKKYNQPIFPVGRLPDLSKFDLQTLQYNLTSVDGNSVPQFLQM